MQTSLRRAAGYQPSVSDSVRLQTLPSDLTRNQSGRSLIVMRSVPKAHNVIAQGNALGWCEVNRKSPNGAKPATHPHVALSGLFDSQVLDSWGDAPGFHIGPRCGKGAKTQRRRDYAGVISSVRVRWRAACVSLPVRCDSICMNGRNRNVPEG